jgi:hypothetical protein
MRIVGDFRSPGEARVEALAIVEGAVLGRIQQVATALREGHERGSGPSSAKRTGFDEARAPQVFDLLVAVSGCTSFGWFQVTLRHGAKRADRRQQPHVGPGEFVRTLAKRDALSAATARQGESS